MSASEVLGYAFSALDRLGITPIIQAMFIALVAIAIISSIYAYMNRK